eukprot:SAG31_NODE_5194_length_2686_cov_6.257055_3_plen_211_part_00
MAGSGSRSGRGWLWLSQWARLAVALALAVGAAGSGSGSRSGRGRGWLWLSHWARVAPALAVGAAGSVSRSGRGWLGARLARRRLLTVGGSGCGVCSVGGGGGGGGGGCPFGSVARAHAAGPRSRLKAATCPVPQRSSPVPADELTSRLVSNNGHGNGRVGIWREPRRPSGQGPNLLAREGSAPGNRGRSLRPPPPEGDDGERARQREVHH